MTVKCDEACTVSAGGMLTVTEPTAAAASTAAAKGRTHRFTIVRVRAQLAKGQARTLRLVLPKSGRRLLAHRGTRGVARIRADVTDAAGNARHAQRTITIRRHKSSSRH